MSHDLSLLLSQVIHKVKEVISLKEDAFLIRRRLLALGRMKDNLIEGDSPFEEAKVVEEASLISTEELNLRKKAPLMKHDLLGGRLRMFQQNWVDLQDPWAIKIISQGVSWKFKDRFPKCRRLRRLPMKLPTRMMEEVLLLKEKGAIQKVGITERCFLSSIFMVPKGDKKRLIINLKPLNKSIVLSRFKMLSLKDVKLMLPKNAWMISIDLQDAYFHVPIANDFQKYLAFQVGSVVYKFICLPFGLNICPRIFTKILKPLIKFCRLKGIQVANYLDDFILWSDSEAKCKADSDWFLRFLQELGWKINFPKSHLIPTQRLQWLGLDWNLVTHQVSLPEVKLLKLQSLGRELIQGKSLSRRELEKFVGQACFATQAMTKGRLLLHPVVLWMNRFTKVISRDSRIQPNCQLRTVIQPWLDLVWPTDPLSLTKNPIDVRIMTDASSDGYGAVWGRKTLQGSWTQSQRKMSMNNLELLAIVQAFEYWGSQWANQNVLVMSDNRTSVAIINHQGSITYTKLR